MQAFRRGLSLLLIFVAIVGIWGCHRQESFNTVDWKLHGVWVNPDGTVQDDRSGVDFSVSGTLPLEFENYDLVDMDLNFTWPGGTVSQSDDAQTYIGHAQYADKHENQRIYLIAAWLHNPEKHESTSLSFALCPEEGFVLSKLGEDYLVASIDPNADPAKILTFYKTYAHVSE